VQRLKLLVAHPMASPAQWAAIAAVDSRIDLVVAPHVNEETQSVLDAYRRGGVGAAAGIDMGRFEDHVGQAEVIYGLYFPVGLPAMAPSLKWVHLYSAGVDTALSDVLDAGIAVTTSSGANAGPIAEFVLGAMIMHAKHMQERVKAQLERRWVKFRNAELGGKTIGIVGVGHIGSEVARRAAAFDMRVLGARRSYVDGQRLPQFDEVYPNTSLAEMLRHCDYVVVAVSLTPETRGMIGEAEFRAMKPGAFFINVSRGPVADERALIGALAGGHLGGAALDVFEREPLPPESELWDMPNVFVSAHNSSGVAEHSHRATEIFAENRRRYLSGQPLLNQVDPAKGY
jgi:phosphoglycerate dehydrogenase-like enzyme